MRFRKVKKKKTLFDILYNAKTVSIIGFVIISLLSVPLWRKIDEKKRMDTELNNLQKEVQKLNTNNKDLNKMIGYLKSDYFAEEQARLNLGLKKKGEKVYVIKGESDNNSKPPDIKNVLKIGEKVDKENVPNIDKWINYFFGS